MTRIRFPRRRRRFRTKRQAEINDELCFYLEMRAQELERQGLSPDAARAAAREAFGSLADIASACAAAHPEPATGGVTNAMHQLLRDLVLTLRAFRRSPLFYASAIVTAGLGIGANTAVFSIFNWAYLGHAPGVVDATELRTLRVAARTNGARPWPHATYAELRDHMHTVRDLVAFESDPIHVAVGGETARVEAEVIAGPYLRMLGLVPYRGRFFSADELTVPGVHPVAVVSHRFWTRHFGSDAPLDDAVVTINGRTFTVIGVAPPGFHGAIKPGKADVWVPVMMHAVVLPNYSAGMLDSHRNGVFFQLLGRRVGDADARAIQTEAEGIIAQIDAERPLLRDQGHVQVYQGAAPFWWDVDRLDRAYRLMTGVVILVLLIASANIANLLLARASARRRDIAVQLALGVSRYQLIRRQLVESLGISIAGAATGLLVAQWIIGLLEGSALSGSLARLLPSLGDVAFDGRVFGFTMAVTVVTAVVVGLVPAIAGTRQAPAVALVGGHGVGDPSRTRLRTLLTGVQMTVSMVLLVTAGLFLRTIRNLNSIDYGFDVDRVMTFSIDPGTNGYDDDRILPFYRDLLEAIRGEPGVAAATIAWRGVYGMIVADAALQDPSQHDPDEFPVDADLNTVGRDYFETLGIELLEGRDFTDAEAFTPGTRVLVINRAAAQALWPNQSAVGRTVRLEYPEGESFTIVGIVGDVQLSDPMTPPEPMIFAPLAYAWMPTWVTISVRGVDVQAARAAAGVVQRMDPTLPVYDTGTIAEIAEARFAEQQFVAKLTGLFAILAVTLAFVGLYGVVAYTVSQRQRELGIRIALGARAQGVVGLVLGRAFAIAGWGAAAGIAGSVAVGRLVENRLYGVEPLDATTIAVAALTLTAGVLLASALPARRAARVDPVTVLRSE